MNRSIWIAINYTLFLSLFLNALSSMNFDSLFFIDYINITGAFIFLSLIIKSLIEPYIIINEHFLQINREHFKKEKIDIQNIRCLENNEASFSSSYFLLQDGKKVKINPFALRKKDRHFLMSKFSKKKNSEL
jgi:hypothetical protein